MATDIYLLGAGIRSALHLTVETIQALTQSRVAFVLHDDLLVHDELRKHCADIRDLAAEYEAASIRKDVYREISHRIVDEVRNGPGVSLVTHGHPLFLVSAAEYTLQLAEEAGLTVRVLPAVSSFDTLMCDLLIDYGYAAQIYDASTMLDGHFAIEPRVPLLVFQVATINQPEVIRGAPSASGLAVLVERLAEFYPRDHPCTVVHSASHILEQTRFARVRLGDLERTAEADLWLRPTLFVPALAGDPK